ncbi:hypothetical protein [Tardiphaga sp.]|uniref:hypothetical protein n=1 Tax=Tardiphaga sp. TaxID=1926292 RepID=UPI0037D9D274
MTKPFLRLWRLNETGRCPSGRRPFFAFPAGELAFGAADRLRYSRRKAPLRVRQIQSGATTIANNRLAKTIRMNAPTSAIRSLQDIE